MSTPKLNLEKYKDENYARFLYLLEKIKAANIDITKAQKENNLPELEKQKLNKKEITFELMKVLKYFKIETSYIESN